MSSSWPTTGDSMLIITGGIHDNTYKVYTVMINAYNYDLINGLVKVKEFIQFAGILMQSYRTLFTVCSQGLLSSIFKLQYLWQVYLSFENEFWNIRISTKE